MACSVEEDPRGCAYGVDASAAFMPAGTRMYAGRGYATEFRLAAVWRDRIFLYQVWRNPRAKVGGDLYDIAGKIRGTTLGRPFFPEARELLGGLVVSHEFVRILERYSPD